MLPSFHLDRQEENTGNGTSPPTTWIIAPKMAIAYRTAKANEEGCPDGHDNGDRNSNKQLIDAIK
jgi:hypothetical protein